jgi:hypothetical protein
MRGVGGGVRETTLLEPFVELGTLLRYGNELAYGGGLAVRQLHKGLPVEHLQEVLSVNNLRANSLRANISRANILRTNSLRAKQFKGEQFKGGQYVP